MMTMIYSLLSTINLSKLLKSKTAQLIALAILVLFIGIYLGKESRGKEDQIAFDEYAHKIDSFTYIAKVNVVKEATYKRMNDSLTLELKNIQEKLDISDKQLKEAIRIKGKVANEGTANNTTITSAPNPNSTTLPSDSTNLLSKESECDSIKSYFDNGFDRIEFKMNTCNPDGAKFKYEVNTDVSVLLATTYKPAKTKFGKWWNKLWKRQPEESIFVVPDNPNSKIGKVKAIRK